MADPGDLPPPPEIRPQLPDVNSGCATATLVLLGIILLLPGFCSVLLIGQAGIGLSLLWWVIIFALAVGGAALLIYAFRNSRGFP
jgi:hypothetical protein